MLWQSDREALFQGAHRSPFLISQPQKNQFEVHHQAGKALSRSQREGCFRVGILSLEDFDATFDSQYTGRLHQAPDEGLIGGLEL